MTVVNLSGKAVETGPNKALVEMFEEMLERARSGYLVGAAVVCIHSDGGSTTGWEDADQSVSRHAMLAGADILHHRLLHRYLGDED